MLQSCILLVISTEANFKLNESDKEV